MRADEGRLLIFQNKAAGRQNYKSILLYLTFENSQVLKVFSTAGTGGKPAGHFRTIRHKNPSVDLNPSVIMSKLALQETQKCICISIKIIYTAKKCTNAEEFIHKVINKLEKSKESELSQTEEVRIGCGVSLEVSGSQSVGLGPPVGHQRASGGDRPIPNMSKKKQGEKPFIILIKHTLMYWF